MNVVRRSAVALSLLVLACVAAPTTPTTVHADPPTTTVLFHGVTPARLRETRSGVNNVTIDHLFEGDGVRTAASTLDLLVAGRGGVPASAGAVALNVTAIAPSGGGFITVYPTGQTRPLASNLNLAAGRTLPNMVVVPVGTDGYVSIYNQSGTTHLAVDVLGWFPDTTDVFGGLTPARLLETRTGAGKETIDHLFEGDGRRPAASTLELSVADRGGVPSDAGAVVLNVTAINPSGTGFLKVYPTGQPQPLASNLNLAAGRTLPNMVIVPLGTGGKVSIYNAAGTTDLAVDVLGWFPAGIGTFAGVAPARLLETRTGAGKETIDHLFEGDGVRAAASTLDLDVGGRGNVPIDAGAAVLNVTAINPSGNGFITVFPTGETRPNASNLNLAAGRTLPNMVIVPLGTDGKVSIYNATGTTHLAIDVLGWFPEFTEPFSTTRVSVSSSFDEGNGAAQFPDISADGEFVAFESAADNLVAGDTNVVSDVFVREVSTGIVELVNLSTAGVQSNDEANRPSLSEDGRYVAFDSQASNLVAGDTNGRYDVFVRDRQTDTTTRVSVSSSGVQGALHSYNASISADGRYVVFESDSTTLVAGDTNGESDVFLHDRTLGTTTRVSVASDGGQSVGGTSVAPRISANGAFVVFESVAVNLVADDSNVSRDIFVHEVATGLTTRVTLSTAGTQANAGSEQGRISADGRYVVFASFGTNLVADDTNDAYDVFVRDRLLGTTVRVSVSGAGEEADGPSFYSDISADGRYIAFDSKATNLSTPATAGNTDMFLRDMLTGSTTHIAVADDGTPSDDSTSNPAISGDGRLVIYMSESDVLVPDDLNALSDIFLYDQGVG